MADRVGVAAGLRRGLSPKASGSLRWRNGAIHEGTGRGSGSEQCSGAPSQAPVTRGATVTPTSGTGIPTGTVTFKVGAVTHVGAYSLSL
jgi:hypothetical protein